MEIPLKKLTSTAILPTFGSDQAAGLDLYADVAETGCKHYVISAGWSVKIGTGVAVAIPNGYVGLLFARSGLATKSDLAPANKVGVIDSDYRGELIVALHNHGLKDRIVNAGERIAQLVIVPCLDFDYKVVEDLDSTKRGTGGFGSTGI